MAEVLIETRVVLTPLEGRFLEDTGESGVLIEAVEDTIRDRCPDRDTCGISVEELNKGGLAGVVFEITCDLVPRCAGPICVAQAGIELADRLEMGYAEARKQVSLSEV